jgi:hypothetical protein
MRDSQVIGLRHAIENLIDAKFCDALGRPDGLARLIAQRTSGVASTDIRCAERALDTSLNRCLLQAELLPAPGDRRPAA